MQITYILPKRSPTTCLVERMPKEMEIMTNHAFVPSMMIALAMALTPSTQAASRNTSPSAYMGGPVELVKAPNGAIANKKLLDRVGDFN